MADFDAPSGFAFTWDADLAQRIYYEQRDALGPSFQQQSQDAETYADAMCFAVAKLQIDEAAAQTDPMRTSFLIDDLERDYMLVPEVAASLSERRIALAAAMGAASGSSDAAIQAGLSALLGASLRGWRTMRTRTPPEVWGGDWTELPGWESNVGVPGEPHMHAATYDATNERWIVVGYLRGATSDNNGDLWTSHTPGTGVSWAAVAASNGNVVAVAAATQANNNSSYSADGGISWSRNTIPDDRFPQALCYGNGLFVAVGNTGLAATSADNGATWTVRVTPNNANLRCVIYTGARFVALSASLSGTSYVLTSTYGDTWFAAALPEANTWTGLAFDGVTLVAVEANGNNHTLVSTDGGLNWSVRTNGAAVAASESHIIHDGSAFIWCRAGQKPRYSRDGYTWTEGRIALPAATKVRLAVGDTYVMAVLFGVGVYRLRPDFDGDASVFPSVTCGGIAPVSTQMKTVSIGGSSALGQVTIDQFPLAGFGTILSKGDLAVIGPGTGNEEIVTVTDSSFRIVPPFVPVFTFTATLTKPHEAGELATTQHFPRWGSSARHYMIFVDSDSTLNDRTLMAKLHLLMRKMVTVASTWTVIETSFNYGPNYGTPMVVGGSCVGRDPIGLILVNE